MERKLIQLSPSTLVVSLPSSWIKANKLIKGTSLFLDVNENKIIISSETTVNKNEIAIDISRYPGRLIWLAIDNAYIAGYDSIMIKTKDSEQSAFMTKVVKYFPGMMIIDSRKTFVHFKAIDNAPIEFDKILKRVFNLIISLLEESIESMKSDDFDDLRRIKYRDYIINSYISYCLRSISKSGYKPFSKIGVIHSFVKLIEMFADKLCLLFESIALEKKYFENLDLIVDMINQVRHIHFNYSDDSVVKLENARQKLIKIKSELPLAVSSHLSDINDMFFAIIEHEMQLNF